MASYLGIHGHNCDRDCDCSVARGRNALDDEDDDDDGGGSRGGVRSVGGGDGEDGQDSDCVAAADQVQMVLEEVVEHMADCTLRVDP